MVSKFCFIHTWGNDPIWRAYFSDGLKPPTRCLLKWYGGGGDFFWFLGACGYLSSPLEAALVWQRQGSSASNLQICVGPWWAALSPFRCFLGLVMGPEWLIIPEKEKRGLITWSCGIWGEGAPFNFHEECRKETLSGKFGKISVWNVARWTRFGRITISRETVNCELLTIPKPINLRRLACFQLNYRRFFSTLTIALRTIHAILESFQSAVQVQLGTFP